MGLFGSDIKRLERDRDVGGLKQTLMGSKADERARAVDALGRIDGDPAIETLLFAMRDSDWTVRSRAEVALKACGPAAIDACVAALRDTDWDVRGRVAWILGQISGSRATPALLNALNDVDPSVRGTVAEVLGDLGDRAAVDSLIFALSDSSWTVRMATARALGQIGDPKAVEPLIEAISDPTWGAARGAATWALGVLGDQRAVQVLIDGPLKDANWHIVQSAVEALEAIGGPIAKQALAGFQSATNPDARASN